MQVVEAIPQFGTTLRPGYSGFVIRRNNLEADGIAWGERFTPGLPFIHTFVVTDSGVIEAHIRQGVHRASFVEYTRDLDCEVYVREPIGYSPEMGNSIVAYAESCLGQKYGTSLILADFLANTYIGHFVNQITGNWPNRIVTKLLNGRNEKICSELVAASLRSQVELQRLGCLQLPPREITPKMLGNDDAVYEHRTFKVLSFQ